MAKREIVEYPGMVHHQNPIPNCVKIGNMVFSSAFSGHDPETGELPADAESQARNCFENVRRAVEAAGGTTGDIARITVFMRDLENRQHVNAAWLAMFPDENDRPARHTQRAEIPARYHVQLEFVAVL